MHLCLNRIAAAILGAVMLVAAGETGEWARSACGGGASARGWNEEWRSPPVPGSGAPAAIGLLREFRIALADIAWVRMSHCWEECDPVGTLRGLRLATTLNPGSLYFCLNGARILAYDFAAWRIQGAEAVGHVPEAEKERIAREQGREAVRFLEAGIFRFPGKALPLIELAQVKLRCLHDSKGAAEAFARAADCRDAPDYASRIAAELHRDGGELQMARTLLEKRLRGLTVLDVPIDQDRYSSERTVLEARLLSLKMDMEAAGYRILTEEPAGRSEKDVE